MIKYEFVHEMPPELLKNLSETTLAGRSISYAKTFLTASNETWYLTENGKPLLLIGSFAPSLLSSYRELWMYGTTFFKARHAREIRPVYKSWLGKQTRSVRAQCFQPAAARFLRFMGFEFIQNNGQFKMYEAQ